MLPRCTYYIIFAVPLLQGCVTTEVFREVAPNGSYIEYSYYLPKGASLAPGVDPDRVMHKHGAYRNVTPDKFTRIERFYVHGEFVWQKLYYPGGQLQEHERYRTVNAKRPMVKGDGERLLIWANHYSPQGKLTGTIRQGSGLLEGWYPSGKHQYSIPYHGGRKHGIAVSWDEDGKVSSRTLYLKGDLTELDKN